MSKQTARNQVRPAGASRALSLPSQWLVAYDDFITKNAGQVSQIESALRSLTYIIPGRFRDAEIASESIHSGVQLLSLYHDALLNRATARLSASSSSSPSPASASSLSSPTTPAPAPTAHARYTRHWTAKSKLYRRVAMLLQMVIYTELLCEMAAKRRAGNRGRWRVVVLLEGIKAVCRLVLMRATRSRPLVTPGLPEREPIPEDAAEADDFLQAQEEDGDAQRSESELMDEVSRAATLEAPRTSSPLTPGRDMKPPHQREWTMPRTGMSLPSLPDSSDISSYLLSRVLTAEDIKPAARLVNRLDRKGEAAEVLHILVPLIYACALAATSIAGDNFGNRRTASGTARRGVATPWYTSAWAPWALGVALELAARRLRADHGLRTTALEKDEWNRRAWGMGWWAMRGAFYEGVTKGVVGGVRNRMPGFVAGILEDYEYLWENYYFSTSR